MTQVITRYFETASKAYSLKKSLQLQRFPGRDLMVFTDPDTVEASLAAEHVLPATAAAYKKHLAKGGAVFLAKATYKPLGAAQLTRDMAADAGAADMGALDEEVHIKDPPPGYSSVLRDHPHFLSSPRDPDNTNFYMAAWPIPLINRRKPSDLHIFPRHGRMASWPVPLLKKDAPGGRGPVYPFHARMANFPIPLISKRKPYTGSIFARHARMANFPIPLISRRKPYTGTAIGRHTRMANWPFPHLINGKMGTNALVPGGKRMANFPISLLSKRKPFTGSIFSRHARMANFPIGLLSKRKPYTGSIFSRHARMANFMLPLVIKRSRTDPRPGFSLSRMFGIPTVIRRAGS